ncbi:uncharacterized protein LAESUDRAFT_659051 [Laetiporus sulphureus 93-53]|uniref:Transmembrane protein n=1 Tax=Laetiporus sulphureus 93-53 TaxID=1314785 RepID=A0A165CYZ4_9APHY|nr:uncharacterized protein LAESUDRAFT_659051 [Laetiporus sulphureus 93-53]KZT03779.1 hypothetical protein LAESUDRAFT_659051 [Laetiporus sulphureus 93-53]
MAIDWESTAELDKDSAVFIKFMHALAGLYIWEVATSFDFEWSFITGKRKFQWPLIFYFLGRYSLFFTMIGILIALDTETEVNCQALYTYNQFLGDGAVGFASINLSIRTIAIWSQNKYITALLVCVILGHWSIILQGVLLKAEWVPGAGCAITHTNNTILAATFIYSMAFDALVMTLSAVKLAGRQKSSQLVKLLFKDGLIYFVVAFAGNLVATIFMCLNLNAVMSVIFNVPAAVASTIAACRAVRRLTKFSSQGPEVYSASTHSGGVNFRSAQNGAASQINGRANKDIATGVHVQMQTFTVADEDTLPTYHQGGSERPKPEDLESAHSDLSPIDYKPEAL